MTLAAIYARYSTDRQDEASIADQLRVCRQYAQKHGWTVNGEYTDEGVSGCALGNRPGALRMLEAAYAGQHQVVIVMELWRLARSEDLPKLVQRLKFRGTRLIGVQDSFDSTARTARMQAGLAGIMGGEFIEMVSRRTHSALEMRARALQPTGGRAYGYRDGEDKIVREIFERFAAGESLKAIASDLNRRDVPSPGAQWKRGKRATHGRWLVSALHELLKNERYAGRLVWNRSQWIKDPDTGKRRRVERPQSEWIVQEIEPLVDADLWAAAQLRFRPGKGRGGAPKYLLSGLLQCGLCHSKLIIVGGSQRRYVCGTYHAGGAYACSNRLSVPRVIAEERILEGVVNDLLSPRRIAEGMREMREAIRESARSTEADRQIIELERLVREGILSPDVAAPALAEARRRAMPAPTPLPSERMWREGVAQFRDVLQGDDIPLARDALRRILGPITVRPSDGHLVAELAAQRVLLATGTGSGIWVGSGGPILIHIPTSTRQT